VIPIDPSPKQESLMRRYIAKAKVRRFLPAQAGTTSIEYALIASGVSVAIIGAVTGLGSQIMLVFYDKLANLF
jgi:Flp pilus assembly pilin Flp